MENFPQWSRDRQRWQSWSGCEAHVPDNPPGHHPLLHGGLPVLPPPRLPGERDDQQRLDQVSQGQVVAAAAELKEIFSGEAGQYTFIANKSRCFRVVPGNFLVEDKMFSWAGLGWARLSLCLQIKNYPEFFYTLRISFAFQDIYF